MIEVVGIGDPIMDFLIHTNRIPVTNGVSRLKDYSWQGGGKVPTALVALGILGVRTGIIGVVGADAFGRFCIDDFKRHNVDTSRLIVDPNGRTTFCICLSEQETQGRSFIGRGSTVRKLTVDDLDKAYVTQGRFLHLSDMDQPSRQAAVWAREKGVTVAFDADYYHPEIEGNYELIDVFIASEFYYNAVFKDDNYEKNCKSIQEQGPEIVVFTFGERGCLGVYGDKYFKIPAFKVEVMDTTGAGDVYHGAFIYGLLQGWDVEYTARFSSAVSAIKCTRVGGRAGIPDVPTVEKFLKDGVIDYTEIDRRVDFYREYMFNLSSEGASYL
ncbi:MAG: carbohydrate kinase family protein [Clostridiales bacterium]|jgi:sugar/nucleoside kinase (ribokinase family)|nr:carbohydrate kinase family protein [Clostridiales bacterium]